MKKSVLFLGLFASLSLASCASVNESKVTKECDTDIIVECQKALGNMSKKEIYQSQNVVMNNISMYGGINYKIVDRYDTLNNAFVISVNSEDVEAVKAIPGVKSVTRDTLHWVRPLNYDDGAKVLEAPVGTVDENISATTMHKPAETNDGEGTVVAILDNEFYFKGATSNGAADGWHHEVYTELDSSVAQKFTFDNLSTIVKSTKARKKSTQLEAGVEGSLYYNSKVPFYYDYGGTALTYGSNNIKSDYDVHSEVSYHGSHVSSITGANAPTYKGIAPKAQLACMKVFTEYKADDTGKALGFSDYSGAYDRYILSALEDCIKLKVDGINMSLGSDLDDFDGNSITLKTLTKLNESGILTSIAAGNSGKSSYSFAGAYGNWTKDMVETGIMSSYANNKASMTVASGQPTQVYYENALFLSDGKYIAFDDQVINRQGYTAEFDTEHKLVDLITKPDGSLDTEKELQYVFTGKFGASSDYNSIDVEGKIAIVNRGSTSFEDKVNQATSAGAAALIIINNDPTATDFNFRCSFGDTEPDIPVSLLLFRDKPYFEAHTEGSFKLISKKAADNETPYTLSTFTTDGAAFDYDLKPEITTPGESIRGAVPPQTKEDKADTPLTTYQYLSGTSMAAPNYAGAQAVLLSKVAGPIYHDAHLNSTTVSADDLATINAYRETVNMRLMSTAEPMFDSKEAPEAGKATVDADKKVNYSSPRLQGSGMANIGSALSTDVYFEGFDALGNPNKKSKVSLFNTEDIAKGDIKAKFIGHNESNEAREYNVKITVMRPGIALNNDIVTGEYNYKGQCDDIKTIPGFTYYTINGEVTNTSSGTPKVNDVVKVTKPIDYWTSAEDFAADHDAAGNEIKGKSHYKSFEISNYYCTDATPGAVKWEKLPSKEYQSVQDTLIGIASLGKVTIAPGDATYTLNTYSLSQEVKTEILANFTAGCAIEGFLEFESTQGKVDLGMPFLGFYSGTDVNEGASYEDCPVVEDFEFEQDPTKVYPSDLVNNIAQSLVGKDNAEMGSMWVTGYAESTDKIGTEKVLTNDLAWDDLSGFRKVGTDVRTGEYINDAKNNIYVGNPEQSNTMIIQQYVMRSVANNYFEIKNKATGETVYKSVLEDFLFGEQAGKYPLYKSHVEANYLSAGYIAHRAYAIIPLYDADTNIPFASGDYEITFKYLLAATNTWVDKAYTFHIDSTNPEISKISTDGTNVRIDVNDANADYGVIGYTIQDLKKDATTNNFYMELTVEEFKQEIKRINSGLSTKRIFVGAYDKAGGYTGALILANDDYYSSFYILQGSEIDVTMDFKYENGTLSVYKYNAEEMKEAYTLTGTYTLKNAQGQLVDIKAPKADGCNGAISASIIAASISALAIAILVIAKKRKFN